MSKLTDTSVSRCGETERTYNPTGSECDFKVSDDLGALEFAFSIPSKGGGTTCILLEIGPADIATIFNTIVSKWPDNIKTKLEFVPNS